MRADVSSSAPSGTKLISPRTVFRATLIGPSKLDPLTFAVDPAGTNSTLTGLAPIEACQGKPLSAAAAPRPREARRRT
jgi:hypothetical protein